MILFTQFIFGSLLGSFFACIAQRRSLSLDHSHCEACKQQLTWHDLIPLVSYLSYGGRCPYCQTQIPRHLFWLEIISGINLMVVCHISNDILWQIFALLLFFMAIYDYYHFEISWNGLLVLAVISLIIGITSRNSLLFALIIWLMFEGLVHLFPNKFGGGDAKIIALLAMTMPVIRFPLFLTVASGTGIIYHLISKKGTTQPIPFIPFLYIGYLVVQLFI